MISRRQCLLLMLVAWPAFAQTVAPNEMQSSKAVESDSAETTSTASELMRSRAWALSEAEWRRYQSLLLGIRGSVSPANLSPIEVLGIHARDEVERRRYAEIWARAMFEDAERILAFQRAYDAAARRLDPALLLINNSDLRRAPTGGGELGAEDRILFFTRLDCPACDAVLATVLRRLDEIDGLDVYVTEVSAADDGAIRQWAASRAIQPDWVRAGRVSLNYENGVLMRIGSSAGEIPALYVRRGDDIRAIAYSDL